MPASQNEGHGGWEAAAASCQQLRGRGQGVRMAVTSCHQLRGGGGGMRVLLRNLASSTEGGARGEGAAALHAIGSKGGTGKEGRCNIMPAVQRGLGEGGQLHHACRFEVGDRGRGRGGLQHDASSFQGRGRCTQRRGSAGHITGAVQQTVHEACVPVCPLCAQVCLKHHNAKYTRHSHAPRSMHCALHGMVCE